MRKINCARSLLFTLFILFACEKETPQSIEDTKLITNPIALDIAKKLDQMVQPYQWGNSNLPGKEEKVSFTEEYGRPKSDNLMVVDTSSTNTLIPLVDENNQLKSWLVGYFNENNTIEYRVRKIDIAKEGTLNLNNKNLSITITGKPKFKRGTIKNANESGKGQWICGDEYYYGCVETENYNGGTDKTCKWFYKGERCVYQTEDTQIDWIDDGDDWEDPFGGGGGVPPCPDGYIRAANGVDCIASPCARIAQQMEGVNFMARIEILKDSTGIRKETGYAQYRNGTFSPPLPASANGHSLDINVNNNPNIIGYIHTHLDNWDTGKKIATEIQ